MLLLPLRWPFSCSFTLRSCFAHILLPREVAYLVHFTLRGSGFVMFLLT